MADETPHANEPTSESLPATGEQPLTPPAPSAGSIPTESYSYQPGDTIGPYTLRKALGRGGFGEVWRAERTNPDLTVAIKLIRRDKVDRKNLARFSSECQAVALLDHPNIARIHDAGVTEDGVPYLAMEYIHGVPLHIYCDRERLGLQERLELVAKICDAVHHAHTQGIIHRDLKPENVLVSIHGSEEPQPKVVDFGIAKAVNKNVRLSDMTITHDLHTMIGTPAYMSPEQTESTQAGVDTRTDIFALGVMLYELLTGALPIWEEQLEDAPIDTVLQAARQDRPVPVARLATMDEQRVREAAFRRGNIDPDALQRQLRSRLHHLPMKAMRIDRNKRFSSAAAMATDIRNYLEDRDFIEAAAEPWLDRAIRRVRHHRLAYASAAIIVLLLIGGVVATSIGLQRALVAEATAAAEAERARTAESRALTALEAEEQARQAERVARREAEAAAALAQQRFDEARAIANTIMFELHPLVRDLPGATPAVRFLIENTQQYLRQLERDAHGDLLLKRDIAVGLVMLGDIQMDEGDRAGALENYRRAAMLSAQLLQEEPDQEMHLRDVMIASDRQGDALRAMGKLDEAMVQYQRSREINQQRLDEAPESAAILRDMLTPLDRIGDIHFERGEYEAAQQSFEQTLSVSRQLMDAEPNVAEHIRNHNVSVVRVGRVMEAMGDLDGAMAQYQRALNVGSRLLEFDGTSVTYNRDIVFILNRIGRLHLQRGAMERATDVLDTALGRAHELAQLDTSNVELGRDLIIVLTSAGELHHALQEYEDASAKHYFALEVAKYLQSVGGNSTAIDQVLVELHRALGETLVAGGDGARAMEQMHQAVEVAERLVQLDPTSIVAREARARTMQQRSRAQWMLGQPMDANQLDEDVAVCQQLVSEVPALATASRWLVGALLNRVHGYMQAGNTEAARNVLKHMLSVSELAMEQNPWATPLRLDVVEGHVYVVKISGNSPINDEAILHIRRADTLLNQLDSAATTPADAVRAGQLRVMVDEQLAGLDGG